MERSSTAGRDQLPALGRVCHACEGADRSSKAHLQPIPVLSPDRGKITTAALVVCRPGSTEWSESTRRSCDSHIVLLA